MILFTFLAGMRVGEVANLLYGDVIDPNGDVKPEIYLASGQTKGDRGRIVMVSKRLQDEIQSYTRSLALVDPTHRLFWSQRCRRGFTADSLTQLFKKFYIKTGLVNGSSHSGRRSFITNLAAKGVSARVLQELAGHRHLSTTQRYIDVNDEMKRNAIELI
jgi:integrase/recombinase XerD